MDQIITKEISRAPHSINNHLLISRILTPDCATETVQINKYMRSLF